MTTVTHGADPEALERLAEELLHTGERIAFIGRYHADRLQELPWDGPDATRARQQWAYLFVTVIRPTATALAKAAQDASTQAREQREASEAGGGATSAARTAAGTPSSGATTTPGTSRADRLGERLSALAEVLANMPDAARLALVSYYSDGRALVSSPTTYQLLEDVVDSQVVRTGVGRAADTALNGLGIATGAWDAYRGHADGDAARMVNGGVSAAIGVAGVAGAPAAGPVGLAWAGGWAAGTGFNHAIEGTSYGDSFQRRNDAAFDTLGAAGMLIVPGNIALAAWDTLTGGTDD